MKHILIAVFLLLTTLNPVFAADQEDSVYDRVIQSGKLRCGYYVWPPYFELDPNTGKLNGFFKEASDTILNLVGLKVEYVEITYGLEVEDLKRDKVDVMCGAGPFVIPSIKFIDYSDPYIYAPIWAYARETEDRFDQLSDMNNADVIFTAIDGDLSESLAKTKFPKARLLSASGLDQTTTIINIITGKADIFLTDNVTAAVYNKSNVKKIKRLFEGDPVAFYPVGFSVKMGEQQLLNVLNHATHMAINTGALEPLMQRYEEYKAFKLIKKPYGG